LLAAGCGDSTTPKADVSGKVTMDGKPLTGVSIRLSSQSLGGGSANLEADGTFASELPFTIGEYQISFDPPGPTPGETPGEMTFPKDESGSVPAAYRSPESSGLSATVTEDASTNYFEFELSSNKTGGEAPTEIQPPDNRVAEPISPENVP